MDSDSIQTAIMSVIGRWVAFVVIPAVTTSFTAVAYWLQNAIGIDLQAYPAIAATFVGTVALGIAGAGIAWLINRGKHEVQALNIKAYHEQGRKQLEDVPKP